MSGWKIVALTVMGLAGVGHAEQVEFTPFYGYALGGKFREADTGAEFKIAESDCYGGMLDIRLSRITQLELFFSRQETDLKFDEGLFDGHRIFDLDVDYYHIGGTRLIPCGPWQPFVVGTLGATHLNPDAPGTDSLTRFSIALGGGLRYLPTKHLGLYAAARGFVTFIEGDTVFRSESGVTTIEIESDGLWQVQLQAGLIFAF